jgi:hypothetical protein
MSLSDDIAKVIELAVVREEKVASAQNELASAEQDGKIAEWVEKIASKLQNADRVSAADVARFLGAHDR